MVVVITSRLLDGCSYLVQSSGWLLLFFMEASECLLFFPVVFWTVPVFFHSFLDGPVFFWHGLNGCSTGEVAHNHA